MKAYILLLMTIGLLGCSKYDEADIRHKSIGMYDGVVRHYNLQNGALVYAGQSETISFTIDKVENPFHLLLVVDGVEFIGTEILGSKNAYNFNLDNVVYKGITYSGYTGCENERGIFDGTYLTETRQVIFYLQRLNSQEVLQFSGAWSQ
jgi:hypothetical protein